MNARSNEVDPSVWWMIFAWQGNSCKCSSPGMRWGKGEREKETLSQKSTCFHRRLHLQSVGKFSLAKFALLFVRQIHLPLSQHKYLQIRLNSQVLNIGTVQAMQFDLTQKLLFLLNPPDYAPSCCSPLLLQVPPWCPSTYWKLICKNPVLCLMSLLDHPNHNTS